MPDNYKPQDLGEAKPVENPHWPGRNRPGFNIPPPERLELPHQLVEMRNNDRGQTHIIIDRFMVGHELLPGQTKEIDMLAEDIKYFQRQARPDRRTPDGQACKVHPVVVLGIREAPEDEQLAQLQVREQDAREGRTPRRRAS